MSSGFRRQQVGFTLVELVLALVLSGAFLALIAPAIRFAIKQPEQARVYTEASHKALLVSESIERSLKSAIAVSVSSDMRCIAITGKVASRSYCFAKDGLQLSEYGKANKLLVDAVQGQFVLQSKSNSEVNPTAVSDSLSTSVPRELVDLQFKVVGSTSLSFSRLIRLPETGRGF